jgi:hypothetical protein
MAITTRKIKGLDRVEVFLQGGVLAGLDLKKGVYGLDGLTLEILSPAGGTVTFSADSNNFMTFKEILDQINAVVAGGWANTRARGIGGELVLIEDSPASGVTVDKDGTANPLLGFPITADLVGQVYNAPGGGAPELVDMSMAALSDGTYLVITDE